MHFHLLQHVDFEGPAAIADWLDKKNHKLTTTKFFQGDILPGQDKFDVLIVMGGPMGVEDLEQYPWLVAERKFIQQTISTGKIILGICLGAQLIARASGAAVVKNIHKEIGWFDITVELEELPAILKNVFNSTRQEVFHWHGDTFETPEGALNFASSEACDHQGFILHERVIGLQFHIETTETSAELLVDNCKKELDGTSYVQTETEILADPTKFLKVNSSLCRLLENIELAQSEAMTASPLFSE